MKEYATIYIPDPSLVGSRVLDEIETIKSYSAISDNGKATGLHLTFEWGSIEISFLSSPDIEEHLKGLSGFMSQHITDTDTLVYTQARILCVRMALGCVIEYSIEYSDELLQEMVNELGVLTRVFAGMLFFLDYLYDFNGAPLRGIDHDV
ncbi:hypothetical protein [Rubinisphaera sp.]|uniref:hypothetical protein n=1 Tax=Rubinisphaera sp. TaxID=2024857 RepID=UPI000C0EBB8E|nr:hypothetical protein [Rubinisphaera sp.]MBV08076.1 hypothetical protein [Rubinisphaera sp.]HCS51850.1 hypothetical protein [Planctomycetaceae bacterium]|tara:strand:- start:86 stop:535 length:450 start_codon:yes stop_codon:yes gene_type:complete